MEGTDATPEEVAEFREIFNLVDLDGGGTYVKISFLSAALLFVAL